MAAEKPRFKFYIKSKITGTNLNVAAFWERENGMISGCFENDIAEITLKDGTRINPDQVWVNMWDNAKETPKNAGGKHETPKESKPAHWAISDGLPAEEYKPDDVPF